MQFIYGFDVEFLYKYVHKIIINMKNAIACSHRRLLIQCLSFIIQLSPA